MKRDRIFSKHDCEKMLNLFNSYIISDEAEKKLIETLKQQILKSKQVDPEKINRNFVTIDSRIILRNIGNGTREVYQLVFPDHSDLKTKKLSVFSGIGSQIIGSRIGTVIKENSTSEIYYMIEDIIHDHDIAENMIS
jgi:regulator of nucleoside diphosphate kinase